MSFISYAQNFEDVMLWRALKHVERGFYIDIGAQDPVVDSVSLAFYNKGWRGVHVEPMPQYASKLQAARPDETVLQVAVSSDAGPLSFFEFKDTGLSTADINIARRHKESGYECVESQTAVITLDEVLERNAAPAVHWMKVDVEGFEASVIASWQRSGVRPWIVLIESTLPATRSPSHFEWEPLILAKGYRFAYFDGLNRFYVSDEHPELVAAFAAPPNVFDGFVLSGTSSQPFYRHDLSATQAALEAERKISQASQQDLQRRLQELRDLQATLEAVLNSRSWRVTAPMRWLGLQACLLRDHGVRARARAVASRGNRSLIAFIDERPRLRTGLARWGRRLGLGRPLIGLYRLLKGIGAGLQNAHVSAPGGTNDARTAQQLSPRGRHIYRRLMARSAQDTRA